MTCGPGHAALAAVEQHVPYVGVVFTEAHRDLVYAKLEHEVLKLYDDVTSSLYDPRHKKDMREENCDVDDADKSTPKAEGAKQTETKNQKPKAKADTSKNKSKKKTESKNKSKKESESGG